VARRWTDHYTKKAKDAGYGARSVYKLEEIQRRTNVIRRGARAVDLGCYPGSWSRYLLAQGVSRLVGVDFSVPRGLQGHFIEGSALEVEPATILAALGGPADIVVSDMAPNTTGNRQGDHLRQIELAQRALELSCALLTPGGAFVTKLFEGSETQAFVAGVKSHFTGLRRIKPDATRKRSVELFVVATGFRPPPGEGGER
jgi:23S rRNA (uridine2552-2'-O)-methyltransferase